MSLTLTTVVDGTLLTAAAVEDYIAKIERYGNEGVANADLDTAPWVNSVHIFKPEFYGSPSPRTQLVSGMAHYFRKSANLYTVAACIRTTRSLLTRVAASTEVGLPRPQKRRQSWARSWQGSKSACRRALLSLPGCTPAACG